MSASNIPGLRHELLDRAYVMFEMFSLTLCEPACGSEEFDGTHSAAIPPSVQIQIESISRQLYQLYQAIGALEDVA